MLDGLFDRLSTVKRSFGSVLQLGSFDGAAIPHLAPDARITRLDAGYAFARATGGVQAREDRPPFADASFDLILSAGVLDQVDDLPGALVLARRMLVPDGLFLAAFLGAGSLPTLRAAMAHGDGDRAAPRLHPQIDVRAAGDLLMRAGFALPVADSETLDARYGSLPALMTDLRGMAASNILTARSVLTRNAIERASRAFAEAAEPDARTRERFVAVVLTGWAPDPSQPAPARRGSATASLGDALRPGPR